jgi:hypothetical protein
MFSPLVKIKQAAKSLHIIVDQTSPSHLPFGLFKWHHIPFFLLTNPSPRIREKNSRLFFPTPLPNQI